MKLRNFTQLKLEVDNPKLNVNQKPRKGKKMLGTGKTLPVPVEQATETVEAGSEIKAVNELELLKQLAEIATVLVRADAANRIKSSELGRILIAQMRTVLRALPEDEKAVEAQKTVDQILETKNESN